VSKQCVHDQFLVVNVVNTLICYEMLLKNDLIFNIYIIIHFLSSSSKQNLDGRNRQLQGAKLFC